MPVKEFYLGNGYTLEGIFDGVYKYRRKLSSVVNREYYVNSEEC